ncbi:MAG: hypothetical protein IPK29_06840 [Betaproteobacteria bacterium]|nr:hypothetical protein [Betaproteobacteria bacterium]
MFRVLLAAAALACTFAVHAQSSSYPNKPIRAVVAFGTGGATDVIARIVAASMSQSLGQSVIIENRPGADGIVAGEYVTKAAPDGYTLFFGTSTQVAALPFLRKNVSFDPLADYADRRHRQQQLLLGGASQPAGAHAEGAGRVRPRQLRQAERGQLQRGRLAGPGHLRKIAELRPAGDPLQERDHRVERRDRRAPAADADHRHAGPARARRQAARPGHAAHHAQQGAARPADHGRSRHAAVPRRGLHGPVRASEDAEGDRRQAVARTDGHPAEARGAPADRAHRDGSAVPPAEAMGAVAKEQTEVWRRLAREAGIVPE